MKRLINMLAILLMMSSACSKNNNNGSKNPVSWNTDYVQLEADDFFIIADNDTFFADVDSNSMSIFSDPGDSAYTTLEVIWQEKGVEMRLFIYFIADGTDWWSEEFRTYDGQPSPDWIYYYGTFFKSHLGSQYAGDFEQSDSTSVNNYHGKIYFENLRLRAFLTQ
jgi:hypothetical protein